MHQPRLAQHPQVPAHRRPRDREAPGDLARRDRSVGQQLDDLPPDRVGEHGQQCTAADEHLAAFAAQSAAFATHDVAAVLAAIEERATTRAPGPPMHEVRDLAAPTCPARLYRPTQGPAPLVVYLHGGGWSVGSVRSFDRVLRRLADGSGAAVLGLDYRLAPEHRWPASVDDTVAALRWVAAGPTALGPAPTAVAVAGDSAGGLLAALACLRLRDEAPDALPDLQWLRTAGVGVTPPPRAGHDPQLRPARRRLARGPGRRRPGRGRPVATADVTGITALSAATTSRTRAGPRPRSTVHPRRRETPMDAHDVTATLAHPVAQELLTTTAPGRLAYTGLDGDPRVVPIGFWWTGTDVVIATVVRSAKVAAIRRRPRVALTVDSVWPPKVLLIRGAARVDIVQGVPDEYVEAARLVVPADEMAQWEAGVRALYDEMAVLTIRPDHVVLQDFVTTLPKAVADLIAEKGDPR